jgi:hypothetical protein
MPGDTDEPPSSSPSPLPGDAGSVGPATARAERPMTLAGLLEALTAPAGEGNAAQGPSPAAALLDRPVADGLASGLLSAIRTELGSHMGDFAVRSLEGKPLTRRTARRILQAAVNMSAARKAALLSAGLPQTLDSGGRLATPGTVRDDDADQPAESAVERRVRAHWLRRFAQEPTIGDDVAPRSAPPSFEEARKPLLGARHPALLEYCAELVRESRAHTSDACALGEAAQRLHDRVRECLEKRGHWPLVSAAEYQEHAKPIAVVLAAWNAPNR